MKIPKTFLPEKGLENKLGQLTKEPKTYEKEYEKKPYSEELEKLLSEFNPIYTDYDMVYLGVKTLAEKTGYKQINEKPGYEYWVKPTGFGESYILVSFGKKSEKHYMFARAKDENVQKFYKRLEHRRKMVYPKSFLITGSALIASSSMIYACATYPEGTFLREILYWMLPSMVTAPTVLSIPRIIKYVRNRVGKGLDKYCIGLIAGDDKKALEAAFS